MRWKQIERALLELLYPSRANCMGCGSPLGVDDGWLCEDCIDQLMPMRELAERHCPKCSRPVSDDGRCLLCKDWPKDSIDGAWILYPYRRPIDMMIRRMKYGGVRAMADQLGRELALMMKMEPHGRIDAIVPVPMHDRRKKQRGFNHAELIAEAMADELDIEYRRALRRVRHTKQQAKLSRDRRDHNLIGAFSADDSIRGLRVLLIDDVLTSGSTAVHCALSLKRAGAESVHVSTIAGVMV